MVASCFCNCLELLTRWAPLLISPQSPMQRVVFLLSQALMGASCFCDFLELLTRSAPLLDAKAAPTLSALAAFAAEFKPAAAPATPPAAPKGDKTEKPSLCH